MKAFFEKWGVNPHGLPSFIAYGLVVAFYSLTPVDAGFVNIWDKLLHFGCYGAFAAIAWFTATRAKSFYVLCGVVVGYSALMEVGQSFVPGRMMSGLDIVANALGVAAVAVLYVLYRRGVLAKP
jgi:VanZ family protein